MTTAASTSGRSAITGYTGVRIFSATMAQDRAVLGDHVSDWLRAHPQFEVVETVITQSSDDSFHCLAITIFYREP